MFKILRWDAVITGASDLPKPLVYFQPNLAILDYARKNNYQFQVNLSGTKKYDGTLWAIMDKSSSVPNCRPNFFEATNLYVLTLLTTWNGYPETEGSFSLNTGIIQPGKKSSPALSATKPSESESDPIGKYVGYTLGGLAVLVIFIVIILSALNKK